MHADLAGSAPWRMRSAGAAERPCDAERVAGNPFGSFAEAVEAEVRRVARGVRSCRVHGPSMDHPSPDDDAPRAEYETWHLHDAGGPVLRLKVRYRDDAEVSDWRDGPELAEALDLAAAEGWHAYDREPGAAPGEYAIFHLRRAARPGDGPAERA